MYFQSSFFFMRFVSIQMVHPYNSTDAGTTWTKSCFILSGRSDFDIIDNLPTAVYALCWIWRHCFELIRYCYRVIWIGLLISTLVTKNGDGSLFKSYELGSICVHVVAKNSSSDLVWAEEFVKIPWSSALFMSVIVFLGYRLLLVKI